MKSSKLFLLRLLALVFVSALLNLMVMHLAQGAIRLDPVLQGLSSPVYVTSAHDNTNRLFIVEQPGRIKVLASGATTPTVYLDIVSKVRSTGSEQGLLGLAFHPQFAANSRFFVNYTRQSDGATVIAEYHAFADPVATAASEIVLLVIPQPFANHNGGMIEFGNDGFLYIGMGDGGSSNDPGNRAQNKDDLLGKILRIDIDHPAGGNPYSSPAGNPYLGATPGRDEIYALGMRNPFRFSFDRQTGQLYVGDVGQDAMEEVDIVTAGGNYGWRVYEGTQCTNLDPTLCTPSNYVPPIAQYGHTGGRCSITGGYVYRGPAGALPAGTYVFGDYCTGEIFSCQWCAQPVARHFTEHFVVRRRRGSRNLCRWPRRHGSSPCNVGRHLDRSRASQPGGLRRASDVHGNGQRHQPDRQRYLRRRRGAPISGCSAIAFTGGSGNIRTAVCSTSNLAAGTHSIVATYSGDVANLSSSNTPPLMQVITGVAGGFTNGGFEVPNLGGGFQYAPAGATWVFTGAGISGNGSGFTSGNPPAPEGVQVAFLQGSGSQVAQSANIAAGTYTLSIRAAQRGNFQSGTQVLQVLVDGVPVGQFQPPSTAYTNYQTPAFTIATTGSHTLSLAGIGAGSDFTAFVDDVRLAATGVTPGRPNDQLRCARRPDAGRLAVHGQCDGIVGVAGELLVAHGAGMHGFRNHRDLGPPPAPARSARHRPAMPISTRRRTWIGALP